MEFKMKKCFGYVAKGKNGKVLKTGQLHCQRLDHARFRFNKEIAPTLKEHIGTEFFIMKCEECESKKGFKKGFKKFFGRIF